MNSMIYKTVDEYLADLPIDEQQALQRLRDIIKSTVPNCHERIAYKICVFSVNRDLVGFTSQKNFLSFYTMSPKFVKTMRNDLKDFEVSGATIHFTPDRSLHKSLIDKILKARLEELSKI